MRLGNVFDRVCLGFCLSVRAQIFESLESETLFLVRRYVSERLGKGRVLRSLGQCQGHTHSRVVCLRLNDNLVSLIFVSHKISRFSGGTKNGNPRQISDTVSLVTIFSFSLRLK